VSFSTSESEKDPAVNAVHIRVLLPRPVKVEAGQYINLWIPSVSLRSWMQTHPFTVTSWSRGKQDTMELLVEPRTGFTADILRHAPDAAGSSLSFLAFFTGPHGVSEKASDYESILVLTSGSGIAVAIPYLKKMIYGYNTCTSQVRRLHLVWQVESVDKMTPALSLINKLLKDDIVDDGYVCVRSTLRCLPTADTDYHFRYFISRFTSAMTLT
jgi:NAD(P)H-flavin reductase